MHAQAPESQPSQSLAERWGRTVVEIDLPALQRNVGRIARLLPAGARIIASVKKDAYGHGLLPAALALSELPVVGALGVATIEEALALIAGGCELPILCFSVLTGDALREAIAADVALTVTRFDEARAASEAAEALGVTARAHFKVDTGMGRMGLLPGEVADQLAFITQLPAFQLEAVYSHLADGWHNPASARDQATRMETFRLRAGVARLPVHWGGSDAVSMKELFGARVWLRAGIAIYGDHAGIEGLEPVMTFKTRVIYRRAVPEGTAISYGATQRTARPTELAIIGAGYGNGYPRILSGAAGGGAVLIRGVRCPILGRVCMDQIVVDATEHPDIEAGDEVVLFGRQGEAMLPAAEVAAAAQTISYELFCLAGQINPKIILGAQGRAAN